MNKGFKLGQQDIWYIDKSQGDRQPFSCNYNNDLSDNDRIVISNWTTSTIEGDTNPITLTRPNLINSDGDKTTVVIDGGTNGNEYLITNNATSQQGYAFENVFRLIIKNRSD